MSTKKSCPLPLGQEDREEKHSKGTPVLEPLECEAELRNKAILQQKRRLKQATQFVHKDSADLLPLDGLTRLGTSKDLQPHSVVQRRLLEGNLNKLRGETRVQSTCVQSLLAKDQDERMEKGEDRRTSHLLIQCQCQGQILKATVNTGCLPNLISKSCLNQLGLEEVSALDCGDLSLPIPSVVGRVEHMKLQFGQETVLCSALVVDDEMLEFCIGLQTLLSLKGYFTVAWTQLLRNSLQRSVCRNKSDTEKQNMAGVRDIWLNLPNDEEMDFRGPFQDRCARSKTYHENMHSGKATIKNHFQEVGLTWF